MAPRGRLAPSPTGALHLGNARTFLLAWLSIRARGGTILLRIEDLDGPRIKEGAEAAAIEDLRWLGLDWDEEPVRQTQRTALYRAALDRLEAAGLAYPCVCTRSEIESAASAPHAGDHETRYPGTCRGRFATRAAAGPLASLRLRVEPGTVSFEDSFRGPSSVDPSRESGDFVIEKVERSGPKAGKRTAAYQLACAVDDDAQGIDEVLRGDDLLGSAARQILVQRALGLRTPLYAHLPLILGEDGRRLAKRHGDTTLRRFRRAGIPPEAVVGWLAAASGLAPRGARLLPRDLIPAFSLDRVSREPVVFRPHEDEVLLSG